MATHDLCFNHFSIDPMTPPDKAYELMFDAFQGALALNTINDAYTLYSDYEDFGCCQIGSEYSYDAFKNDLMKNGERDLFFFASAMEDHSPFIDYLHEEAFNELSNWTAFFPDRALEAQADILTLAWQLQGVLLSLNTDPYWDTPRLRIAFSQDYAVPTTFDDLRNISRKEHGDKHRIPELLDWTEICPDVHLTSDFLNWEMARPHQEKALIRDKIALAYGNNFDFHRPLVDVLHNSRHTNLKELRIGGQIRILFARLPERNTAILCGLFKQGRDKDYIEVIRKAEKLLDEILSTVQ